ncbi:ribonuclease E activity regulator RraA [Nocardiopsis lambiniae]|uniref:4-hydroxy-4-methyl-2-oxoglutarate aldolase n=1 Tax=Nocardiopsis lambiniae TaxID=3075539 RepID=A0ABU2M6F6_9ACTN|nr:ribonuclease E activity regulator RraA [Nocardiopsis sp. DSM 44743]MDT0328092.1 ribonuclease E activity regulator RraA [Nocardiopsis sp. DSM 44743]
MRTLPLADELATADLLDQHGALEVCRAPFRRYGGRPAFHGPLATVRCRGDNGLVKRLVSEPGHGRVLFVDGGGALDVALVGDNVAEAASAHDWAGIVVHGAVRDSRRLAGIDLGVIALGTDPRRPSHRGEGETDVPIRCGGTVLRPGALLFADEDGVLVAPLGFSPPSTARP